MTRKSHHSPSSMPPATAGPSIAAITGLSSSSRVGPSGPRGISPPLPRGRAVGISSSPSGQAAFSVLTYFRSQPAQNAPPAPYKTATEAFLSASNSRNAAVSASALFGSIALRASGRSWITVHIDPSFSILTVMKTSLLVRRRRRGHFYGYEFEWLQRFWYSQNLSGAS